ncbi:hypothetical protein SAY86_014800 [Trapa natans]|uniref:BHLH domain-containing protein n=1 Tax=Trapa natans TaxID=22666 RepID=A0AAN7KGM1_TRANT|nr:hypothetical protein SAY86_014800 [Trapa natans]
MVRASKSSLHELDLEDVEEHEEEKEEEEEEEEEENYFGVDFTTRPDSTAKGDIGQVNGKKGNANTTRSKHSETEQRRRSKINQRFQTLRDLIPQKDQKRDKASFLSEVIEYIQFLQDKILMYNESYQGYHQEPTKLTPWMNNSGTIDSHLESAQFARSGTSYENNFLINPGVLAAATNSLQHDIENAGGHVHMQSGIYASVERGGISNIKQEPLRSVGNMTSHLQPQLWPAVPFAADYSLPNSSQNQHKPQDIENGENLSSAYSQGILNTLTQALQNAGVELSQTSISVQIDVRRRANPLAAASLLSSKDHENHQSSCQTVAYCEDGSSGKKSSQQPLKKLRTEKS